MPAPVRAFSDRTAGASRGSRRCGEGKDLGSTRSWVPRLLGGTTEEPPDRGLGDLGRDGVGAGELAIIDVVAPSAQQRHDSSAAALDRQHPIAHPVGDVDDRPAAPRSARHEAGREGDQIGEEISVPEAKRQRVRRAVREATQREASRIDRDPAEDLLEQRVDRGNVRSVSAPNGIPRWSPGLRCEKDEASIVGQGTEMLEPGACVRARAVEENDEWPAPIRPIARGYVQEPAAARAQGGEPRAFPRRGWARRVGRGPGAKPGRRAPSCRQIVSGDRARSLGGAASGPDDDRHQTECGEHRPCRYSARLSVRVLAFASLVSRSFGNAEVTAHRGVGSKLRRRRRRPARAPPRRLATASRIRSKLGRVGMLRHMERSLRLVGAVTPGPRRFGLVPALPVRARTVLVRSPAAPEGPRVR